VSGQLGISCLQDIECEERRSALRYYGKIGGSWTPGTLIQYRLQEGDGTAEKTLAFMLFCMKLLCIEYLMNHNERNKHRLMAWGVQRGRRLLTCRQATPETAVSGVTCLQGVEGWAWLALAIL
jgi:hypothetical protein